MQPGKTGVDSHEPRHFYRPGSVLPEVPVAHADDAFCVGGQGVRVGALPDVARAEGEVFGGDPEGILRVRRGCRDAEVLIVSE